MSHQPDTAATTNGNGLPPADDSRQLVFDVDDLAAALKVSPKSVRRFDTTGAIPRPVKLGRLKRWPIAEITAWLEAGSPDRREWEAIKAQGARERRNNSRR